MESSSTASLQQQMHTITNFSATTSAGTSNVNASSTMEDEAIVQCPSCDKKLHRFEVASHCEQEMQRLKEQQTQSSSITKPLLEEDNGNAEERSSASNGQSTSEKRKPWTVFQKVQRNRQSRMKQRTRKRPAAAEHPCPVCNIQFPQDEIQQHAEACLRRSNRTANGRSNSDEHSSNDDEDGGGEEYEEYEWAGQKRIRVSSLLQGGYAALGIGQAITNGSSSSNHHNGHQDNVEDDDEDLNVDEDDTQIYGPAQYGESDVIPSHILNEDESDITSYMRRLITGSSSSSTPLTTNLVNINEQFNTTLQTNNDVALEHSIDTTTSSSSTNPQPSTPAHYQQIIDCLKAKLRHYEQQHVPGGKYKCLICLDDYRNPAISVACWHVHCEQCWLRSLGARKLCPQCNLITTPKDLRRIYM